MIISIYSIEWTEVFLWPDPSLSVCLFLFLSVCMLCSVRFSTTVAVSTPPLQLLHRESSFHASYCCALCTAAADALFSIKRDAETFCCHYQIVSILKQIGQFSRIQSTSTRNFRQSVGIASFNFSFLLQVFRINLSYVLFFVFFLNFDEKTILIGNFLVVKKKFNYLTRFFCLNRLLLFLLWSEINSIVLNDSYTTYSKLRNKHTSKSVLKCTCKNNGEIK